MSRAFEAFRAFRRLGFREMRVSVETVRTQVLWCW